MPTWESPHGRPLPPAGQRTLIMAVLNATPDSFSDGGVNLDPERAAEHAERLLADGADILDVGGESTRPGADPVGADEERSRVLPVIEAIRRRRPDAPVSIDTHKADVARAAIEHGADLINDVWGFTFGLKPDDLIAWRRTVETGESPSARPVPSPMAQVAAETGCPAILMHNRKTPEYQDFWPDLLTDLRVSLALAREAGVPDRQLWLDPGFGFGKKPHHNLEVLKHLDRVVALGFPVLLGTSRKSTLGLVLDRPVDRRQAGNAATAVWGIARGCQMVRVHDAAEIGPYVRMADAIRRGIEWVDPAAS